LYFSHVAEFVTVSADHSHSHEIENESQAHENSREETQWSEREVKKARKEVDLQAGLQLLRRAALPTNPLLWLLVLPGLALLRGRMMRSVFAVLIVWLLLLATVVDPLVPQLELERMLIVVGFVGCVPAALAIRWLFEVSASNEQRSMVLKIGSRLTAALVGALLLIGPFISASVAMNRAKVRYFFASSLVEELTEAISLYSGSGRTVFPGFILHELSNGHIAPLALFSGKPLVASSPYHTVWRYTELVPDYFLNSGAEGLERYLNLLNATLVVAHEANWKTRFESEPHKYEKVWSGGRFTMYKRLIFSSNYFEEGADPRNIQK